jgi:hypothetical protein
MTDFYNRSVYCAVRVEAINITWVDLSGFNPRSVHVRSIVDKVALGDRLYSEYFGSFPASIIPQMLHTRFHLRAVFTRRTKEKTCEPSKSNALLEIREQ